MATGYAIGGNAPSDYPARIKKREGISDARMHEILRSHVIDPEALHADDFEAFWKVREAALLDRIGSAIGKAIPRGPVEGDAGDTEANGADEEPAE